MRVGDGELNAGHTRTGRSNGVDPSNFCSLAAVTEHIDPDEIGIGIGIVLESNEAYSSVRRFVATPPVLWSLVRGFVLPLTCIIRLLTPYLNPEPPSFPLQLTDLTDISPLGTGDIGRSAFSWFLQHDPAFTRTAVYTGGSP